MKLMMIIVSIVAAITFASCGGNEEDTGPSEAAIANLNAQIDHRLDIFSNQNSTGSTDCSADSKVTLKDDTHAFVVINIECHDTFYKSMRSEKTFSGTVTFDSETGDILDASNSIGGLA